ncbi:MAG: hypothetical protein HY064_07695 [Bacteroidetes bacterium]|nr:hypothetical protein [Bacteroidota bacterium]
MKKFTPFIFVTVFVLSLWCCKNEMPLRSHNAVNNGSPIPDYNYDKSRTSPPENYSTGNSSDKKTSAETTPSSSPQKNISAVIKDQPSKNIATAKKDLLNIFHIRKNSGDGNDDGAGIAIGLLILLIVLGLLLIWLVVYLIVASTSAAANSSSNGSNSSSNGSSGSSNGGGSSGCYIATMVYGSYDAEEVMVLRRFRDEKLSRTKAGRTFIQWYYSWSPRFVEKYSHLRWLHRMIRFILDRFVQLLSK